MEKRYLGLWVTVCLLLVVLVWQLTRPVEPAVPAVAPETAQSLESAIREQGRQIAQLQERLDGIRMQLQSAPSNVLSAPASQDALGAILDRLDALEQAAERIARRDRVAGLPAAASLPGRHLGELSPRPITAPVYTPNNVAEEAFQADSGAALDEHSSEVIAGVFHDSGIVQMSDIDCKSSMCKVTYSKSSRAVADTDASDDVDFVLVEQLSERLGVDDLDIRYARDEQGADVMYIQMN